MEAYKSLAARIRSLYFLGTPHRGSEFTRTFQGLFKKLPIIQITENIANLDPTSRLLESLNNEFPQVARDVELRSFWETEPSFTLGKHQFVVPKHSACLNYTNEVSDGLNADHRGMCKYDRPTNPNFVKVRNALSSTVERIVQQHSLQNQAVNAATLQLLRDYLGIHEPPEDDLADHEESCLSNDTCSWFTSSKSYRVWRDDDDPEAKMNAETRDMMLIEAQPGAGKSVLASQVISNLQSLDCECSYYFFDSQDRQKSRLSCLLRSLAFQMALISPSIRRSLLELQQSNTMLQMEDDRYVWRKLFIGCIFQHPFDRQHYWVIDGLDECQGASTLLQMFFRMETRINLKVFMTARPVVGIHDEIAAHTNKITHVHLSKIDTLSSIRAYVEARTRNLRLRKEEDRNDLVNSILDNAEGSFLWVKLVLENMSKATGPKEIMEAVKSSPKGMDRLYADTVSELDAEIPEEQKPVLKSVLDWTLCTNPPLTVEELEAAVKLDTGSEIFADKMCDLLRNLIAIDHGNKVRPIHQTARAFLLKPGLASGFVVSSTNAHQRIANVLVRNLQKGLRTLRSTSQIQHWLQRKAGVDYYALQYFSDHIRRAPTNDHTLFLESEQLLTSYGSSWVACIASTGSLSALIRTSQNLRHWLQARVKHTPPLGELARKTARLQQWTVDLVRLVAKFGRHLLESPGAIYTLVPPFLPKESVLSVPKPRPRDIQVIGLNNERWDDRLCSIFYQESICTAVASGYHNFAVGMKTGSVHLYDNNTMQLRKTVHHGAVVKLLKFNETGSMLLSLGFRAAKMWTVPDGTQFWQIAIREPRLAVEFIEDGRTLLSISSQHKLIKQDALTGVTLEVIERRSSLLPDGAEQSRLFRRELQHAEFSAEAEMLATMERERPIKLTDIEDRYDIGVVELEMSEDDDHETSEQPIVGMTFCANIDIALLAVVYRDGILAIFDRDLHLIEKRGDTKGATILAGSPDGQVLAAANVEGVITLYDFEQLTPLHTLHTSSYEHIRSIVFSGDGHRIVDIRDRQANIWAPAALLSRVRDDSDSLSESTLAPTVATSISNGMKDELVDITSAIPLPKSEQIFCGYEDGRVAVHSTRDAGLQKLLHQDSSKQWISKLVWKAEGRILAFLSGTSNVTVSLLAPDLSVEKVLLRKVFLHPVTQLLIQVATDYLRLFVVTTKTISLWSTEGTGAGLHSLTEKSDLSFETEGLWLEDGRDSSSSDEYLTLVESKRIRRYSWSDLQEVDFPNTISFHQRAGDSEDGTGQTEPEIVTTFDRATSLSMGGRPILFLRSVSSRNTMANSSSSSTSIKSSGRKRWILDPSTSTTTPVLNGLTDSSPVTAGSLRASLLPVSHLIEHIIGFRNDGKQLIFLNKALWVCSYDLVPLKSNNFRRPSTDRGVIEYTRHLFIPDDWISSNYSNANRQLLFMLGGVRQDCLIFVKTHEVAVIRQPFLYAEKMQVA